MHYEITVIKIVWYFHRSDIKLVGKKENSEINPCMYGQLVLIMPKTFQWGKVFLLADGAKNPEYSQAKE